MKHPDEHTLELYVLNADSVAHRRAGIEEHCASCTGCTMLVTEISSFYAELDRELQKPDAVSDRPSGRQLIKRYSGLAFWEERLAVGPWTGWGTPVRKLRHFIRRHPIAAAGTTFAFAALAGMGLLMGYRDLSRDVNPSYVVLNTQNGHFEVYNDGNELLWSRLLDDPNGNMGDSNTPGWPRHQVWDLDGDGSREVLTTINLEGKPYVPKSGLHVFNGMGDHYDVALERQIQFRGTRYEMPARIARGTVVILETSDGGRPEILATLTNDRSPNAIVRMNSRGEVLGEFWHQGQFTAVYSHDVDGDGRAELILGGFNDVDDDKQPSSPVILVLDPWKLVGKRESSVTRGYGYEKSDAELYYIRLPLTEMNRTTAIGAGVSRFMTHGGNLLFTWQLIDHDARRYDLEFVFTQSFQPLRVISTTPISEFFDREYAAGRIPTRMDAAYLGRLKSQIKFWDGERWMEEAVMVGGARPLTSQLR